ncbi:hypothetical protein [Paenibacillus elgii]|uniref:hypothetical protein n=1 Tax=Paenibacillus elgii TaxID=189691 RepID=UPI000FD7BD98|nr:hypothetical protein [Paenibacillus elgii]NEN81610.1 hypothetical protein [Paenibacillus elgii]
MPYVLRHTDSGEIAACIQKNVYDFDYFGVKQWEEEGQAAADKHAFLESIGYDNPHHWHILLIKEDRVKLCNVKLKNDPSRRVRLSGDGQITVHSASERL